MKHFLLNLVYWPNEWLKFRYKFGDFSRVCFARFATKEDHSSRKERKLKQAAFLPHPKKKPFDLSVFDVEGQQHDDIVLVGKKWVLSRKIKRLYGYAKLSGNQFFVHGLRLRYNNIPPRHSNVVGWPIKNGLLSKDEAKLVAIQLVQASHHMVYADPV